MIFPLVWKDDTQGLLMLWVCYVLLIALTTRAHVWQLEAELFPVCFKLRNVLPCGCILFIESGGRKLNENKALTSKKARLVFNPDFSLKKKKKAIFWN